MLSAALLPGSGRIAGASSLALSCLVRGHSVPARELTVAAAEIPVWKRRWDQAREQFRLGNYSAANDTYAALLRERGELVEARREQAIVALLLGNIEQAVLLFEGLLEHDPASMEFRKGLGVALLEKGEAARAGTLFVAVLRAAPDDPTALAGRAEAAIAGGAKDEAVAALKRLRGVLPDEDKVENLLAGLLYDQGRREQLRPAFGSLAEEKERADAEMLRRAAAAQERMGKADKAAEYWQQLLFVDPEAEDARLRLAGHAERKGQLRQAFDYLQPLLGKEGCDPVLYRRAGLLQQKMARTAEASAFMERYRAMVPEDAESLRVLLNFYTDAGDYGRALSAAEKLLGMEPADSEVLMLAAGLYHKTGRHAEAFRAYETLLDRRPLDTELLAGLAVTVMALDSVAAGPAWESLARRGRLTDVLEEVHRLAPGNVGITLRLARAWLERGESAKTAALLDSLASMPDGVPDHLRARGELFEAVRRPEAALADYEALLRVDGVAPEIGWRALRLAGELGRLDLVRRHEQRLSAGVALEDRGEYLLLLGNAYQGCMVYGLARQAYEEILALNRELPASLRHRTLVALAELHREAGLPYEAEQYLRLALNLDFDRGEVLAKLFRLALAEQRFDDAEAWRVQLLAVLSSQGTADELEDLYMAELHLARHEYRPARKLLLRQQAGDGGGVRGAAALLLTRVHLAAGDHDAARSLLQELLARRKNDPELLALLASAYESAGSAEQGRDVLRVAVSEQGGNLGVLFDLVEQCRRYRLAAAEEMAAEALRRQPASTRALFLLADERQRNGDNRGAEEIFLQLATVLPGDYLALSRLAELRMRTGEFAGALTVTTRIQGAGAELPALRHLKARILWEQHEWREARRVYRDYLEEPSAEDLFASRCREYGVNGPLTQARRSLLEIVSFRAKRRTGVLDEIMDPVFAGTATPEDRPYNAAAAATYARYRWQDLFSREMEAREAVVRKEYFYAVKEYEALVRDFSADSPLLFDLAGVYSSLGRLEEEASIYQRLSALNPDYPGLSEAVERNRLKRRPRVGIGFGYDREEGRDRYKDIKRGSKLVKADFSPGIRQEMDFALTRINYDPAGRGIAMSANRAQAAYGVGLSDWLAFRLGGGVESLEDRHPDTGLLSGDISAKLGDVGAARVDFARDVTADTTASLARGIVQERLAGSLELDPLPRLLAGGKYGLIDYSDSNTSMVYGLWASYYLLTEPVQLSVGYSYDFLDSDEGARPGEPEADGFAADDHPYWAPTDYWEDAFNVALEYRVGDNSFERGAPRLVRAKYVLGHDSSGYAFQSIEGDLSAELTRSFLIEARASLSTSQVFRSREVFLAALYRW